MLLLRVKPRPRRRPRRQFATVPGYGAITRVMGGTDGRGFYGNQALGGAISAPVVTTFPFVIPAGYGLVVFQTTYDYTPSDASLLTLSGAGNALTLTPGAQRAHNAAGTNDNSVTFFHDVLASDCSSCTYDASSLPAGDAGRYGQMVFYIVREPDTVNGFFTGTPVTNTQTSTTSVNPGTLTLPTSDCLEVFGASTRNHANDLLPVVESPDEWPDALKHAYFDFVPQPAADYPAAFQNSIIASGAVAGRRNTSSGTSTPVWTFTGSSPTTAAAHSVLVTYNILGGSGPSTLTPSPTSVTLTASSATVAATVSLAAGVNATTLTAASATLTPDASTQAAGATSLTLTAPTATISVGTNVLDAGIAAFTITGPTATVVPGTATYAAGTNVITITAAPATADVPSPGLGAISADGAENYIGGTVTISVIGGSIDAPTIGGSTS